MDVGKGELLEVKLEVVERVYGVVEGEWGFQRAVAVACPFGCVTKLQLHVQRWTSIRQLGNYIL